MWFLREQAILKSGDLSENKNDVFNSQVFYAYEVGK